MAPFLVQLFKKGTLRCRRDVMSCTIGVCEAVCAVLPLDIQTLIQTFKLWIMDNGAVWIMDWSTPNAYPNFG